MATLEQIAQLGTRLMPFWLVSFLLLVAAVLCFWRGHLTDNRFQFFYGVWLLYLSIVYALVAIYTEIYTMAMRQSSVRLGLVMLSVTLICEGLWIFRQRHNINNNGVIHVL
jgi:hypothetical protein